MELTRGNLTARTSPGQIDICNGRLRASFYLMDGGYVQEFHAIDRRGRFHLVLSSIHSNLVPWSEHRACSSPMIAGDRAHLFSLTRDSLRMPYSDARVVRHDQDQIDVELCGSALGHNLKCLISLEDGSDSVHVTIEDEIDRAWADPLVEYFMASYAFLPDGQTLRVGEAPSYVWVPSLRPAKNHVIGDCSFHSPAAVVQIGSYSAALIPDLDLLSKCRPMPTCLDLDLSNGLLPAPLVSFGFCGYEQVHDANYCRHDASHSRRLGATSLAFGCHLILDADCPSASAYRKISRFLWNRWGSRVTWRHQSSAVPDSRPGRQPLWAVDHPDAWAARGLNAAGIKGDDEQLIYRARALKNAALASPQKDGLFPTRYDPRTKEWSGCRADIEGAVYNTVECSSQLYWLLSWHQQIEPDPRILARAVAYAGFLLRARQRNGAIPTWYDRDGIPLSPARSGTQTAPSALFLARLADVTADPRYAHAAELAARFAIRQIVPKRIYEDHLLLDPVNRCTLECEDPHTGARPVSGRAMLWVALLMAELHKVLSRPEVKTGGPVPLDYLKNGIAVLDQLCLLQSIWNKPWAPQHLEQGLCARSNVGARYDAELTAEFARCAVLYGAITGEREYCERGAAALRAVAREPGLSAVSQARVAASAAAVESQYGSIYVHVGRKWAVALNGWRVGRADFSRGLVDIRIEPELESESGRVVFGGMRAGAHKVRLNGHEARYSRQEMEYGIPVAGVGPGTTKEGQLRLIPC